MARKKGKHGRSWKFPILTGLALGVPIYMAYQEHKRGGDGIAHYIGSYLPINTSTGQFEWGGMVRGLGPLVGVFITKTGVKFARVRIPKTIPVSLS